MQSESNSRVRKSRAKPGAPRFTRISEGHSDTAALLQGCAVVSSNGACVGVVDYLMVDVLTQQLRFVVLERQRQGATVAIPWHALYFDSEQSRLVFYTLA